jgi:RNA polymerase sigma factor (sigma-70 family)
MAISSISEFLQNIRRAALRRDEAGLTDGQLLDAYIRSREEAAFAALLRRHGPMVWGVCCRILGNGGDAEDAFQATFLVLVRKAASVVPREQIVNWLYGVARQTAVKARVMAVKRKVREKQVKDMPEPTIAEQNGRGDMLPLLDQELGRLPDKYRMAIVLCDLEGKSYREAARQLSCPEGTLAARLVRGRAMLAKRLARHGLAVTSGALSMLLSQGASADVPASVVSSTIKAANLLMAGQTAAAGAISAKVAGLTEGVLKTMLLSKLKIATALFVIAAAAGAGGVIYFSRAMEPLPARQQAGPNPQTEPKQPERQDRDKDKKEIKMSSRLGEASAKDKSPLQGSWKGVSFNYLLPPARPGFAFPAFVAEAQQEEIKKAKWVITDDKIVIHFKQLDITGDGVGNWVISSSKDEAREMNFKVDLTKKPNQIDFTPYLFPYNPLPPGVRLPPGFVQPEGTCKGIFELEGETLKICYGQPTTKRPTEFKAEEAPVFLFVLNRELPKKDENAADRRPPEGRTRGNSKLQSLLKERVDILRKNAESIKRLHEQGAAGSDAVGQANLRLYKAELDLCETTKDRIAVLEKIANVYKEIEDHLIPLKKQGAVSSDAMQDAKLNRLEAEIALEREKAKLAPPSK